MKPYKEMHREQKSIPKGGLLMSDYITRERNLTLLTDYYEYTMIFVKRHENPLDQAIFS